MVANLVGQMVAWMAAQWEAYLAGSSAACSDELKVEQKVGYSVVQKEVSLVVHWVACLVVRMALHLAAWMAENLVECSVVQLVAWMADQLVGRLEMNLAVTMAD